MYQQTKAHRGWTDLLLATSDNGVPAPPIPKALRSKIVKRDEWCWSTSPEIDRVALYGDTLRDDVFRGTATDGAGFQTGRGTLDLMIVDGSIAVSVHESLWGWAPDPVSDVVTIARTYAIIGQMLERSGSDRPHGGDAGHHRPARIDRSGPVELYLYHWFHPALFIHPDLASVRVLDGTIAESDLRPGGSEPGDPWPSVEFADLRDVLTLSKRLHGAP